MDNINRESDDEIFADNLSVHSGEELPIREDRSEDSSDSDIPRRRRRIPLMPIQVSDSESDPEESPVLTWETTDRTPTVEEFTGQPGVLVDLENPSDVMTYAKLFISDEFF
jgi:hypothetical protein